MNRYYIDNHGMGNFLNPPGDAEHTYSVKEGAGRSARCMSLRYALSCEYVPEDFKARVKDLLAANPPQFTPEWEANCYAHFKGCYSPNGIDRHVDRLAHKGPPEWHAAVLHIKEFFPEYTPNLALLAK